MLPRQVSEIAVIYSLEFMVVRTMYTASLSRVMTYETLSAGNAAHRRLKPLFEDEDLLAATNAPASCTESDVIIDTSKAGKLFSVQKDASYRSWA
jgi:hypothetical protein